MNWYYAKDGQQVGPVAFTEIQRLHAEGQLTNETMVWQQGTPNWIPLGTALSAAAAPAPAPVVEGFPAASISPAAAVPTTTGAGNAAAVGVKDYGDFLCWGFIAVLIPCLGLFVYLTLFALHLVEFFGVRKAVQEGKLSASKYSEVNPVLFVLGLFCCGGLLYPLFMHLRGQSGYFKPQPTAVTVAIIVVIISIILNLFGLATQDFSAILEQAQQANP